MRIDISRPDNKFCISCKVNSNITLFNSLFIICMMQNSIADAANAAQNVPAAPGQGYNPYPNHGASYLPHQQDGAGHAPAGDYGSVYGNYGY